MRHSQHTQRSDTEIFDPFPAPRGWQLGGDFWAGAAQQRSTTDFMTFGVGWVPAPISPAAAPLISRPIIRGLSLQ